LHRGTGTGPIVACNDAVADRVLVKRRSDWMCLTALRAVGQKCFLRARFKLLFAALYLVRAAYFLVCAIAWASAIGRKPPTHSNAR
jgi:hypothetical protein